MKEVPVTVAIRSRQTLGGETERVEQQAAGTLAATEDGWLLRYGGPEEGAGETRLRLRTGEALLERGGTLATRMHFQPEAVCPARCQTPYGALELSVKTEYLGYALTQGGGHVLLRYHLSAQGQPLGRFVLQLWVRPAGERAEQDI